MSLIEEEIIMTSLSELPVLMEHSILGYVVLALQASSSNSNFALKFNSTVDQSFTRVH